MAILSIALSHLVLMYQILLSLLMMTSFIYYYLKIILLRKACVLRYQSYSGWDILWNKSEHFKAIKILSTTVISSLVVILHYQMKDNNHQCILIFKDALTHNAYRQLKVQLKLSGLLSENDE